jgi:hypothetical protein
MLEELNTIGSEDEATRWAHRRLKEENKLNAADARHIEEAFAAKLLGFAIHKPEGAPQPTSAAPASGNKNAGDKKGKAATTSSAIDKSGLTHPEPRRVRDRDHVRFVPSKPVWSAGGSPATPIICAPVLR